VSAQRGVGYQETGRETVQSNVAAPEFALQKILWRVNQQHACRTVQGQGTAERS
jgi:hypothetical protein